MAFNWKTFWTRAFTALIFVAVMMGGLLYNEWSFFLLIAVIHFGCWWEYLKLVEQIYKVPFHPYIKFGFCLTGFHMLLFFCNRLQVQGYNIVNSFSLPFLIAGLVLLAAGIFKQRVHLKATGVAAFGLIYISLSWGLLLQLRYSTAIPIMKDTAQSASGFFIPVLLIVAIWINDTCAYLVGSMIGKTPFSKISPKKHWRGPSAVCCFAWPPSRLYCNIGFNGRYCWVLRLLRLLREQRAICWNQRSNVWQA